MTETRIQEMTEEAIANMGEEGLRNTCMNLAKTADRLCEIVQEYGIKREGQLLKDMLSAQKETNITVLISWIDCAAIHNRDCRIKCWE